jgi:hypothetical protein
VATVRDREPQKKPESDTAIEKLADPTRAAGFDLSREPEIDQADTRESPLCLDSDQIRDRSEMTRWPNSDLAPHRPSKHDMLRFFIRFLLTVMTWLIED